MFVESECAMLEDAAGGQAAGSRDDEGARQALEVAWEILSRHGRAMHCAGAKMERRWLDLQAESDSHEDSGPNQ